MNTITLYKSIPFFLFVLFCLWFMYRVLKVKTEFEVRHLEVFIVNAEKNHDNLIHGLDLFDNLRNRIPEKRLRLLWCRFRARFKSQFDDLLIGPADTLELSIELEKTILR